MPSAFQPPTAALSRGADSRRSPRRVFNRAIGVLRGGDYHLGQAMQIGEGGLAFVSSTVFAKGERIVATLVVPGAGCLVVRGRVIGQRAKIGNMNSYSIEFTGLELHQRRMIRSYVSAKTEAEARREDDEGTK